ncbi:MAG: DUF3108 domain-containing protein [Steroidobacteraceae bacterium]
MKARLSVAIFAAGLLNMTLMSARAAELKPFTATYQVVWHGITAGTVTYSFEHLDGERWSYGSRSSPVGMARMFLPDSITQRSVMQISNQGVQPLSYDADDGTSNTKRDSHLQFDWNAQRVRGVYEQENVDLALRPGVQDDLSVQIALIHALNRAETPTAVSMVNKNTIRDYQYQHESSATLDTPVGKLASDVYVFQRVKSPRQTRFWCAPSLGYLPIRAEQRREGKVEWTMQITSVQRAQ